MMNGKMPNLDLVNLLVLSLKENYIPMSQYGIVGLRSFLSFFS